MSHHSGMGFAGLSAVPIPSDQPVNYVLTKESAANYDMEWLPGVNIANPLGCLYVFTPDNSVPPANGSVRICFTPSDPITRIELKASDVWNLTGFRFSGMSVELGYDLVLGAVAGFLETNNPSMSAGHDRTLLPHIEFTSADGTISFAHYPVLNIQEVFVVNAAPATGELVGATIGFTYAPTPRRVINFSSYVTGTTAATAEIQHNIYQGTDNTGALVNQVNLPASDMPASTPLVIPFDETLSFESGVSYFEEFVSANSISLATNASGQPLLSHTGNELAEVEAVLAELLLDDDLSLIFDDDLSFVTDNRFAA